MKYNGSELFYLGVKYGVNLPAFAVLLVFTAYVVSGDASTVNEWYGYFFVATTVLFLSDFFYKRNSATQAMLVAVVWCVVWMLWLFAATLALGTLEHLKPALNDFNGTLFIFLSAIILNFVNLFPLFGMAFNEHTGWNRPMKM